MSYCAECPNHGPVLRHKEAQIVSMDEAGTQWDKELTPIDWCPYCRAIKDAYLLGLYQGSLIRKDGEQE